jgi:ubiquinone/menaquinone biosynthesis C-methylase UbiE
MIKNAKKIMPKGIFSLGEANKLLFDDSQFDRVISYSIFHYFPDETYIFQTIDEMIRVAKPGGVIFLGDLLDSNFEQEIKGASDLEYEKTLPYIMRYSQWNFCNLEKIRLHYQRKSIHAEILPQPENFKLSHYRKDIRICL